MELLTSILIQNAVLIMYIGDLIVGVVEIIPVFAVTASGFVIGMINNA